jgi:hypothetical protein
MTKKKSAGPRLPRWLDAFKETRDIIMTILVPGLSEDALKAPAETLMKMALLRIWARSVEGRGAAKSGFSFVRRFSPGRPQPQLIDNAQDIM